MRANYLCNVHLRAPKIVKKETENRLSIGELYVDLDGREVVRGKDVIDLTRREFDLLVCLLRNKNIVMSREHLVEQVWGFDYVGETNVVDVYIRYLRKKIVRLPGFQNTIFTGFFKPLLECQL